MSASDSTSDCLFDVFLIFKDVTFTKKAFTAATPATKTAVTAAAVTSTQT
jgi:hypothetical protein